ncbi:MAG: hypothetical protein WH035_07570, partial [Spirochaetota bacterium]
VATKEEIERSRWIGEELVNRRKNKELLVNNDENVKIGKKSNLKNLINNKHKNLKHLIISKYSQFISFDISYYLFLSIFLI